MSDDRIPRADYLGFGSYDFSNSGYVLIFQSFLFPVFFAETVAQWFSSTETAWGFAIAVSTLIAIAVAPRIGALGDRLGRSCLFGITVVFTGLLAAVVVLGGSGLPAVVFLGFVGFNAVFEVTQSLYDSFLKDLAKGLPNAIKLSSFAWGFGYVGGALFAAAYLFLDSGGLSAQKSLAVFAVAYLCLSWPSVLFFRKHERVRAVAETGARDLGLVAEIRAVLNSRTRSPIAFRHLAIYWLVVDAVAGVMYFAPLFMTNEVGLSIKTVGGLLLAAQVAAAPATYLVGLAAVKVGLLLVIRLTLVGWILALVGIFFSTSLGGVILAMVPMVFVIGSTQALLRAHFSQHVSEKTAGEGFGYYAVAQKSAAVVTPLLVGGVVLLTGSLRPAFVILALVIFAASWLAAGLPGDRDAKASGERG